MRRSCSSASATAAARTQSSSGRASTPASAWSSPACPSARTASSAASRIVEEQGAERGRTRGIAAAPQHVDGREHAEEAPAPHRGHERVHGAVAADAPERLDGGDRDVIVGVAHQLGEHGARARRSCGGPRMTAEIAEQRRGQRGAALEQVEQHPLHVAREAARASTAGGQARLVRRAAAGAPRAERREGGIAEVHERGDDRASHRPARLAEAGDRERADGAPSPPAARRSISSRRARIGVGERERRAGRRLMRLPRRAPGRAPM